MKALYESLAAVAQPVGLLWAVFVAAAVWHLLKRQRRAAIFPAALALALTLVGGTPLPAWLLARLERPYDPLVHGWPQRGDAVVMLGGSHAFTTRSPLRFGVGEAGDRILLALELIRTGHARALVLGGSYYEVDGQRRPDSELVAAWARDWRLPVGDLNRLGICASTRDEAERTAKLAKEKGWRQVILVTSGYHLARAEAVFRKAGVEVLPAGAEFLGLDSLGGAGGWSLVPRGHGVELMAYWLHEQVGWLYYRLKGWV